MTATNNVERAEALVSAITAARTPGAVFAQRARRLGEPVEVLPADGIIARAVTPITTAGTSPVASQYAPLAANRGGRLAGLAVMLPVEPGERIVVAAEDETGRAETMAPTPYGTTLPALGLDLSAVTPSFDRVGGFLPVDRGVLTDSRIARQVIDTYIGAEWDRALDDYIVTKVEDAATAGTLGALTRGSDSLPVAAVKAAMSVRAGNHAGSLALVAAPATLRDLFLADDFDGDTLDRAGVATYVPSTRATEDVVYVGDWGSGITVYVRSGLTVTVSEEHADAFVTGTPVMVAEARVLARVERPTAIVKLS